MSKYLGDFTAGDVIDFKFTTFRPSTGAPFTLAGSPVVSVYKDNDLTQTTTGVALTVDFDSVTGLNHVRVTTTDAFYANGSEFECVITTGTVDSVSVVGSCVGRFTLGATAANVYNALLANYTLANSFGARLVRTLSSSTTNEVTIGGSNHIAANVHAMQNNVITSAAIATGALTSTSFAAGAIDAAAIATDAITSAELSASAVQEIADCVLSRKLNMAGNISDVSVTSVSSATFTGANTYIAGDAVQFITSAPTSFALATKYYVIATSLTATTFQLSATSGGSAITTVSTGAFTVLPIDDRTVRSALRYVRNKVGISGSTMTVSIEDDATSAWTAALTTSPGVDPVTTLDPA